MDVKYRIRVGVVLMQDSKVLLVRMHRENSSDIYVLPGGGINNKEDLFEAAIRETKEETNLDISIDKILYLKTLYTPDNDNALEIILLGQINSSSLKKGYDPEDKGSNILKEVLFVDINDLENYNIHPMQLKKLLKEDFNKGFNSNAHYIGNYQYPEK